MYKQLLFVVILVFMLISCANPLNKTTYYRYLETGANAERQLDIATAEIAYSRALGNVYMGNLGPEREAEALFNLGRLERLNGKLDSSLEHLLKSLEIDENINRENAEHVKSTLGEIAKTYYEKAQYEKGSKYLDRLYELGTSTFRTNQSKRFIKNLFSDYAIKLKKLGREEKSNLYQNIAAM